MIERKWQLVASRNPFFSVGIHVDHADPSVTLHLPGVILACGRLKHPEFYKGCAATLDRIDELETSAKRLARRIDDMQARMQGR